MATFMQYEVFLPPGRTAGTAGTAAAPSRLSLEADARILGASTSSSSTALPSRLSMDAEAGSAPRAALYPKPPTILATSISGRRQPASSLVAAILPSIIRKKLSQEK